MNRLRVKPNASVAAAPRLTQIQLKCACVRMNAKNIQSKEQSDYQMQRDPHVKHEGPNTSTNNPVIQPQRTTAEMNSNRYIATVRQQ